MSWDESAACAPSSEGAWPTELFLVTQRGRAHPGVADEFCGACVVRTACLADGWWDEGSIRGGWTPHQRQAVTDYLALRRDLMVGVAS